ncbi:formate--tetrahydrofolate ligase [Dongshaea marina]|uniref:formate--tetrahydrofolate ligase n=1 Tax=Dongshaea marina TaxID=2047966 RepID=UPI000D3E2F28|nr:formate--tetrahydrofolate ligase [Dongshaea marina]
MISDLEISRQTKLRPISYIAKRLGLSEQEYEPHGHHKAKLDSTPLLSRLKTRPNGKLILVTAITPTPLGEGKTVTTIGLSQALNKTHKALACIRQPSMGPVFGLKGGAAGGGYSQVVPMEEMNLHLTGDIHAVSAAHNLAAAALDARLFHEERLGDEYQKKTGQPRLNIDPKRIVWPRVVDHNDRALRHITVGQGGDKDGVERSDSFYITAASELMAILALSKDLQDMRQRLGRTIVAYDLQGKPITCEMLKVAGAMAVTLKDALKPNLLQTTENSPVLVHTGPFANIAHGNSSVIADEIGIKLADYVVTEGGFGSDMGMEKYFNIKYRQSGIAPSCVVVVATLRGLKSHAHKYQQTQKAPSAKELALPDQEGLEEGAENLGWHIQNGLRYGQPVVVAINRFAEDTEEELEWLKSWAKSQGAFAACESQAFAHGGCGALELAQAVQKACELPQAKPQLLYEESMTITQKLLSLVECGYGGKGIHLSNQARQEIEQLEAGGFGKLPICMAKTPASISHDPSLKGAPQGFVVPINSVKVNAGAGFIYVLCGAVMTMPGLGENAAYHQIDIDANGEILGLS